MFRRYNRWYSRFDQPDPYDGSYDFSDPQSFNRYAYVQNDPVNFVDPTGLEMRQCGYDDFGPIYCDDGFGDLIFILNSRFGGFTGGGGGGTPPPPKPTPPTPCAAQDFTFSQGANGLTANELSDIAQVAVGESGTSFSPNEASSVIDTIQNRLSSNLYAAQDGWSFVGGDGVTYDNNAFSGRNALSVGAILGGYVAFARSRADGLRSGERKLAQAKRLNNGVLPAESDVCKQLLEARSNASRVGDAIRSPGTFVNGGVNSNRGLGARLPSNFTLLFTIGDTKFGMIPYFTARPTRRRR